MIEYRTAKGHRIEVNANGRVVPGTGLVNLRSLGCPEHIARSVENSQILRRANEAMSKGTPAPNTAPVTDADRRAKAAQIGQQIADDNKRLGEQDELRKRMRAASGIVHAR